MEHIRILWADDEIDLLKPQLLFLEKKGYEVVTVTNGHDALDEVAERPFDVVFLDESMPGLTGLETLERIKEQHPHLPVVMITKNEAEHVMEEALGAQISDYLIKPVNPNQILLTLKKIIDNKRLVREKTTTSYQQEFRQLMMEINSGLDTEQWVDVYRKLISWEIRLDESESEAMADIIAMQKREANIEFSKFVARNYFDWIAEPESAPLMSHRLMREKVFPHLGERPTVMVLLDNLRYDQWRVIEPMLSELYRKDEEDWFFSILPTSTQYSRNAIFAGMLPIDIARHYSQWWKNDMDEGGKNLYEDRLLQEHLKRVLRKPVKAEYVKVTNVAHAKDLLDNALNYLHNDLTVIV
ncbi:MAG: response regulator, partial [Bacteroidetes bacterium]